MISRRGKSYKDIRKASIDAFTSIIPQTRMDIEKKMKEVSELLSKTAKELSELMKKNEELLRQEIKKVEEVIRQTIKVSSIMIDE